MDTIVLKKMMPYIIMLSLVVFLFLLMLAPILDASPAGIIELDSEYNLYDELEQMGKEYPDLEGEYDKPVKVIEAAKDAVKELEKMLDDATDKNDIRYLKVLVKAGKLDIVLYGTTIALIFVLSVMLLASVIAIGCFFVKGALDKLKPIKHFMYCGLLTVFIISCVMTGYINSVGKSFGDVTDLIGVHADITAVASSAVLAFALIGVVGFMFYEYLLRNNKTLKGVTGDLKTRINENVNSASVKKDEPVVDKAAEPAKIDEPKVEPIIEEKVEVKEEILDEKVENTEDTKTE